MHATQGAMAIRRERQTRMDRRISKRLRRQNAEKSTRRPSDISQDVEAALPDKAKEKTSMAAFHFGVVFILLVFLLIFSSVIPANIVNADWSRRLVVGVTFLMIGLMMVKVNRIVSAHEEEELQKYVSSRLARTRPGQVLCRERDESIDFSTLSPHVPSSRQASYRDRPGSSRSINRSPLPSSNPTTRNMQRSGSVRMPVRKTLSQPISSGMSRNNSQQGSRYNLGRKTSLTKTNSTDDLRGRASMKNVNPPTVLVCVTDSSNNLSSLVLLNPELPKRPSAR